MSIASKHFHEDLTHRQLTLIGHAANGMTIAEIARAEFIALDTVKNHLAEARRRAGASNTTHLVALAVAAGLLTWRDDEIGVQPPRSHRPAGT